MELLTTAQLAKELGLKPSTVRGLAACGRIPSHPTPGGHHRFALDEVRAVLDSGRRTPPSLDTLRQRRGEIDRLARRHGASNVRVVGSVARGEARTGSDVDFLVDLEPGRSLFDLAGLHDDLEALLDHPVDVLTHGALRGRFARLGDQAVAL